MDDMDRPSKVNDSDPWDKVLGWCKEIEDIYSLPSHEAVQFPEPVIDPNLEWWVSPSVDPIKRELAQLIRKITNGVMTREVIDLCKIIEKIANSDVYMHP
jgi:hypothetical protein